jgi:hypothetical protein
VAVHSRPQAIVWHDRVFESRGALARWLGSRGASYAAWARIHPAASAVIDPSRRAAARSRAAVQVRRQEKPSRLRPAQARAGTPSGGQLFRSLLVGLSLAIGVLCLVIGALPRLPAVARILPAASPVAPYGSVLAAVAAAIFVGLLIALALG